MANAGQSALLAAGYFLGKSKTLKSVLLVASGVAVGRMTAPKKDGGDSSESLLSRISHSELANTARETLTSTAAKGMESLNQILQDRADALRNGDAPAASTEDAEDTDTEEAAEDSTEETENADSTAETEDAEEPADGDESGKG